MPFDTGYALGQSQIQSNDFTFSGYQNTKISFSNLTKSWSIQIPQDSNKTATTKSMLPPFGTHKYSVSQSLGGGNIFLNINACDDSKNYNCKDGSCIDSEMRCDSKIDCFDASDESDCRKILIGANYLRHIPSTFLESPNIIEHYPAFGFLGTCQALPYRRFKHAVACMKRIL